MTGANDRTAHRAVTLGAATTLVAALALVFLPLGSGSAEAAGVHGPYTTIADECATCHRVHTAKSTNLTKSPTPQSGLCLTCHNGTGANSNVQAQYDSAPANNAAAREYYSHEARVATSHTQAKDPADLLGVLNRHSECVDCHNPHKVNATNSTQTTTGWTASGRLAGISGVSVSNTPTVITPTFVDGETVPVTREYQLCFKCHSGFTTLPSNTGFPPSKHLLDKSVEFNPNNLSYHPVEAPGKNTTAQMAASLAGPSPYKLWNFTTGSTVRCSNCHASSSKFVPATPPSAGADLPPHTSQFQGILLQNYRSRVLKSSAEPYDNADFALCFLCHTNSPFNGSGDTTATNFSLHGLHVRSIGGGSASTDIDTAGAGQGKALCAECHFRLHSTTFKSETPPQTIQGSRLVNFAPNVQANGGTLSWTPGSCTLTCHGVPHNGYGY